MSLATADDPGYVPIAGRPCEVDRPRPCIVTGCRTVTFRRPNGIPESRWVCSSHARIIEAATAAEESTMAHPPYIIDRDAPLGRCRIRDCSRDEKARGLCGGAYEALKADGRFEEFALPKRAAAAPVPTITYPLSVLAPLLTEAPAAAPVPSSLPGFDRLAFIEEECRGLEARLAAVGAALDLAGIDPEDRLEEGPCVTLLVQRLVGSQAEVRAAHVAAADFRGELVRACDEIATLRFRAEQTAARHAAEMAARPAHTLDAADLLRRLAMLQTAEDRHVEARALHASADALRADALRIEVPS